jgi:hypothetical protein
VSRNYKIHDQEDLHYLTHATVGWVDHPMGYRGC